MLTPDICSNTLQFISHFPPLSLMPLRNKIYCKHANFTPEWLCISFYFLIKKETLFHLNPVLLLDDQLSSSPPSDLPMTCQCYQMFFLFFIQSVLLSYGLIRCFLKDDWPRIRSPDHRLEFCLTLLLSLFTSLYYKVDTGRGTGRVSQDNRLSVLSLFLLHSAVQLA